MGDGHLNKCKTCTKLDSKKTENRLKSTPEGLEKERARHIEKYYRSGYKGKHKPDKYKKAEYISNYRKSFPEKYKAKNVSQRLEKHFGGELHHWSYNKEHYKDVIELSTEDHNLLHRFLIYDKDTFYYKDLEGSLLNTKEKHLNLYYNLFK